MKKQGGWRTTVLGFDKRTFEKHFAVSLMVLRAGGSEMRLTIISRQRRELQNISVIPIKQIDFRCRADVTDRSVRNLH